MKFGCDYYAEHWPEERWTKEKASAVWWKKEVNLVRKLERDPELSKTSLS